MRRLPRGCRRRRAAGPARASRGRRLVATSALCADAAGRGLYLFGGVGAGGARLGELPPGTTPKRAPGRALVPAAGERPLARPRRAGRRRPLLLLAGGDGDDDGDGDATSALRDAWALDTHRLLWERLLDGDSFAAAARAGPACARGAAARCPLPPADDEAARGGNGAARAPHPPLPDAVAAGDHGVCASR
jgi:hypothetical protein